MQSKLSLMVDLPITLASSRDKRKQADATAGKLSMVMSLDTSLCQCPACRRRFDAANISTKPLSQVEGKEVSVCFYCGCYLVDEAHTVRVITYTEFDLLDEGLRAELILRRVAILDHWRRQPIEAHPKPECSSAAGDPEDGRIRAGLAHAADARR